MNGEPHRRREHFDDVHRAHGVVLAVLARRPHPMQGLVIGEAAQILGELQSAHSTTASGSLSPDFEPDLAADLPASSAESIRLALEHLDDAAAAATMPRDLARLATVAALLTQALTADTP